MPSGSLTNPNKRQQDAYARFLHTLSAACIIGFVGVIYSTPLATSEMIANAILLLIFGLLLFVIGAELIKGD